MKVPEPKKLPSGNYFIQLRLNGVSVPVTRSTAKECKRAAELIKAEHRAEKRVVEKKKDLTLNDAIENYITKRTDVLSPSTIRGYRVVQKNYFQAAMQKQIQSIDWQSEVNDMAREYAPKTVRNAWRFLVSVLAEAGTVAPKITLPQPKSEEREFLDAEQIKKFVKLLQGSEYEIPALLALHSLRRSEIAALDWKNVNLKKQTITVAAASVPNEDNEFVVRNTTKTTGSTRTVPIMIPELATSLSAVEDKTGFVCRVHPNSLYKGINTICERNGLPKVGVHGLRHSFASLAYTLGLSEKQTMELGGWSDFATMRRIYTHLDEKSKQDARDKMQAFFTQNANENANEHVK